MKLSELTKSQQSAVKAVLRFATNSWFNKGKILELDFKLLNEDLSKTIMLTFRTSCFKEDGTTARSFHYANHMFIGVRGGVSTYHHEGDKSTKITGVSSSVLEYNMI